MLRHPAGCAVAAALTSCLGAIFYAQSASGAHGATVASRTPICIAVTDSTISTLMGKVPVWVFTNHCSYAEYFYVEYPDTNVWLPSAKFNPGQSAYHNAVRGVLAK